MFFALPRRGCRSGEPQAARNKKTDGTYQWKTPNSWYSNDYQNLTLNKDRALDVKVGDRGILSLVYKYYEYSTTEKSVVSGYITKGSRTVPVYKTVTVKDSTEKYKVLMALPIYVCTANTWKTGYGYRSQLDYCKPYVGIRLSNIKRDYDWPVATDETIRDNASYRLYDPYYYLSYLANYFFIGGHKITNYAFETMETPVAESLIYYTKGGQTSGNLKTDTQYNIYNGLSKIYKLSVYDYGQYYPVFGYYPLPAIEEHAWNPLVSASPRTPYYIPTSDQKVRAKNLLGDIASTYYLAQKASRMFVDMRPWNWTECPAAWQAVWNLSGVGASNFKPYMQDYNNRHRSVYKSLSYSRPNESGSKTHARDTVTVQVPWYQFPLVFGGTFNHGGSTKSMALEESVPTINKDGNNRHHRQYATQMFFRMAGGATATSTKRDGTIYLAITSWADTGTGSNGKSYAREEFDAAKALKHITEIVYTIYRVNSYNWTTGQFVINPNVGTDNEERTTLSKPFNSWTNDGR